MLGGGPKLGVATEAFARYRFPCLNGRFRGKAETGYDHILRVNKTTLFVEQKSSTHWRDNNFRWQHIEPLHKWDILLLCGIGYKNIQFWALRREIFNKLVLENKITNQGNNAGDSSEGLWCTYNDIKDNIVPVHNSYDLISLVRHHNI
jgi:hypothetical protein